MSSGLQALLAAIVADPADDTARLVYADCLQENGNFTRAEFIRLQIEAERLHPDSNARAALEQQAETLFAEHWIEWWGEVCTAVGLPKPARKPGVTVGRLTGGVGRAKLPGHPYEPVGIEVRPRFGPPYNRGLVGWTRTAFRRGFPDSVGISLPLMNPNWEFLNRWLTVAPLADLSAVAPYAEAWIDGPHLAGLRSLTLEDYDPVALHGALTSPHLSRLEELTLRESDDGDVGNAHFAGELAVAVVSPRTRQLKRLSIPVWSDREAEAIGNAENLAGLEALEVQMHSPLLDAEMLMNSSDIAGAGRRLATLARSPHLAGMRELRVVGEIDGAGIEAVIRNPTWTGLRKLELYAQLQPDLHDLLTGADDLPELEELRLYGVSYSVAQVDAFARSPMLKRLRHFAVRGGPQRSVDFDIAHAVDRDRIETFAIGATETSSQAVAMLREHFGDRFRLLS